jgi:hypothetical protein
MLRFTIAFLLGIAAIEPAVSADRAIPRQGSYQRWHRTAVILPPGLPRPHYRFRTTISYGAPYPRLSIYENPRQLYAPDYADVDYVRPWIGVPLLPGSSTLPGYYGSSYPYDYQGPYYGRPYVGYWDRRPFACGVYGYC